MALPLCVEHHCPFANSCSFHPYTIRCITSDWRCQTNRPRDPWPRPDDPPDPHSSRSIAQVRGHGSLRARGPQIFTAPVARGSSSVQEPQYHLWSTYPKQQPQFSIPDHITARPTDAYQVPGVAPLPTHALPTLLSQENQGQTRSWLDESVQEALHRAAVVQNMRRDWAGIYETPLARNGEPVPRVRIGQAAVFGTNDWPDLQHAPSFLGGIALSHEAASPYVDAAPWARRDPARERIASTDIGSGSGRPSSSNQTNTNRRRDVSYGTPTRETDAPEGEPYWPTHQRSPGTGGL